MPILKIDILGTSIEIEYKNEEEKRLKLLIENFKNRLYEFENIIGKVSDRKILFLAALKAEDDFIEVKNNIENLKDDKASKIRTLDDLDNKVREIVFLKDQISDLKKKNEELMNINENAGKSVEQINNKILSIIKKIDLRNG
tara:strand:+ start:228 stop:653 length:426 start_codon:yes stop_codon:yes gene_type:complete